MFDYIRADIKYTFEQRKICSSAGKLRFLLWGGQGLQATIVYRFGRWLGRIRRHRFGWVIAFPLYPAYWLLSVCIHNLYDIYLEQSADIASGFCISHFGGIEVRNCRIGSHCYLYQNVRLGAKDTTGGGLVIDEGVHISPHAEIIGIYTTFSLLIINRLQYRHSGMDARIQSQGCDVCHPWLLDCGNPCRNDDNPLSPINLCRYLCAEICADVTVGKGVTIGAGAVVTQDIPSRCLVLGNPGRIAQCNYDNSGFLSP